MNPALSIVVFTVLAGYGQGLVVWLALASLGGASLPDTAVLQTLAVAEGLLVLALGASFLHLGHKMRAWRAVLMWRTSWMSREVIVMPLFMAAVAAWWLAAFVQAPRPWLTGLAIAATLLSLLLWLCTAMIYACLRFVQEWAHPLTIANYLLIGLSSGLVLAGALTASQAADSTAADIALPALITTVAAWICRAVSLRRNARLKPKSTLQSATGLDAARIVQQSMGLTGGSYNTREFFHRVAQPMLKRIKVAVILLGFALPAIALACIMVSGATQAMGLVLPVQLMGLLLDRWLFFAQARHPQNLYYQAVA